MPEIHVFLNDGNDWNTEAIVNVEMDLDDAGMETVANGLRDGVRAATSNTAWNVYELAAVERRAVPYTV